jgi:hypothetical protein
VALLQRLQRGLGRWQLATTRQDLYGFLPRYAVSLP